MTIKTAYLVASDALKSRFNEVMEKRRLAIDAATEYAKELGGICTVSSGERLIGVVFDEHPGKGWRKKGEYINDGQQFYRPLESTKAGKAVARKLHELAPPGIKQVQALVGMEGHMVMGEAKDRRGIPMLSPSVEVLAETLVYEYPHHEESPFKGHPELTEISYADYLELKAKHERLSEAA